MKKKWKILIAVAGVFVGSIVGQFGYNMLFVSPYATETTKGGDGKLTDMLNEDLPDSRITGSSLSIFPSIKASFAFSTLSFSAKKWSERSTALSPNFLLTAGIEAISFSLVTPLSFSAPISRATASISAGTDA